MMNTVKVEFHYYSDDEVAVVLDKSAVSNKEWERRLEIVLFTSVALRNLDNIGFNPTTREMAACFSSVNENNIYELMTMGSETEIVQYRGRGKKRFMGTLTFDERTRTGRLIWKFKGFGFLNLSRDMPIYGLSTGFMLLLALGRERIDDKEYMTWLGKASNLCGDLFLSGRVGIGREIPHLVAAGNIARVVGALPEKDATV